MQDKLGRQDRSADICRALEQIASYLEEFAVDVMLVAGDIFSEHCRSEQMRSAIGEIKRIFLPFIERGGTIVAISGNHDNEIFFETLRDALDLVATKRQQGDNTHPTGQLYIASKPRVLKLTATDGTTVQFVLMPFPTARHYLSKDKANYKTIEDKYRSIQQGFVRILNELQSRLDVQLPSVLVSHIHVRGAHIHSRHQLGEEETVVFEAGDIPTHWAYIAYGHIHQPQSAIEGAIHIRYAGSIERLDVGESQDKKSVVLCEIGPTGLVGEPRLLPLDSSPIYHVDITDPDSQIPQLAEKYPDSERALVKYTLHWHPQKHNREDLCRAIESTIPRWYERAFQEIGVRAEQTAMPTQQSLQDVIGTVRDYLRMSLANDPEREQILALANELLATEVWR
jgi:exonuclease SbcD